MVFENIVVDLVNRFLGDYIDNLDKSQLSLGLWGGNVVLKDLFVKENLLDEFDLPIKVVFGNLGQLTLKIPWKNLYTEPTIAQLDGLYVLAVPNSSVSYDEAKESKAHWDAKQKELARIEEAKKKVEEKAAPPDAKQDSFTEKLATNVIKNLELTITNIHIRYEDSVTNPTCPFSFGITLKELSCRTCDAASLVNIANKLASPNLIVKMVRMSGLSLYWNCGPETYMCRARRDIQKALKDNIGDSEKRPDYNYLIEPLASSAQLRLNMKPEKDSFTLPKILANVVFEEIAIAFGKNQYQLLMELLESLERMRLGERYRKYRPNVTRQHHSKEWWHFAYKCILEETIKRRRRMWSWQFMKAHRERCNEYRDVYKTKLLTSKPSPALLADIERCEKQLDVFNITLMRQQADIAAKKEGAKKPTQSGGWFSGFFGRGKAAVPAEVQAVEAKVQEIMTPEEKQKLYDAIGYEENVDTVYPKEYTAVKLNFVLRNFTLKLKDADVKQQAVMNLCLHNLKVDVGQRPSANAICIDANMESLQLLGAPACEGATVPVLATSHGALIGCGDGQSQNFVSFLFETNPYDAQCDIRIAMSARPLEITYDARTIILMADFFRPPESIYVVQLQAAAMAKFETVKRQTKASLQHSLYEQKTIDISIALQPTCIIIPEQGIYRSNCRLIVVDLGELSVITENQSRRPSVTPSGTSELDPSTQSLDELRQQVFNKFKAQLKSVQLLYANPGDNWLEARTKSETNLHVLNPMAINVDVFQCTVPDPDLPRLKIAGVLPTLNINLTDQRVTDILEVIASIPLPESNAATGSEDDDELAQALKVADVKLMPIREDVEELFTLTDAQSEVEKNVDSAFINAAELEVRFEVKEMCLNVALRQNGRDVPALKFFVESLGAQFVMRSFDIRVNAFLGGIYLLHEQYQALPQVLEWSANHGKASRARGNGICLINTPASDQQMFRLFTVELLMAQRRHPEFATVYENTLKRVTASFSTLEVILHQDAIVSLISVLKTFQAAVEKSQPELTEAEKRKRRCSSSLSIASISSSISKELRPVRRRKTGQEVIDVAVCAKLDNVSLAICTSDRLLADVKITGLNARITVQPSRTSITASLSDISVFDHMPNTIYPMILAFEDGEVFNVDIVVYNNATTGRHYTDMSRVDTSFKLVTGCMQIVVLYRFVQDLLKFLSHFEEAKGKILEAGAVVGDRAVAAAQELSTRASRVSLDVRLKAPIIRIPRSSTSQHAVVVDLGRLTVTNRFEKTGDEVTSADGLPPILDNMTVDLMDMKVFSSLLQSSKAGAECQLLKPVSLSLTVVRNLSASWYHERPDIAVSGQLQEISLIVSQGDMKTLFGILNENLKEGDTGTLKPQKPTEPSTTGAADSTTSGTRDATAGTLPSSPPDTIHSTLKLNFTVNKVQLELFSGDREMGDVGKKQCKAESLARFQLKRVGTELDMRNDGSMAAHVLLGGCELDDTRPDKQSGITRMITQTSVSSETSESTNMIDLNYKQDSSQKKDIDARLNGLHIVVCVEYLLELSKFVLEGLSVVPEAGQTSAKPSSESAVAKPAEQSADTAAGEITIHVALRKPEIILAEDSSKKKTNALIFTMEVEMLLRQSPEYQVLNGKLQGILLAAGTYSSENCTTVTKTQLLQPLNVDIISNAPQGKNHHVEVFVSDVVLTVTSSSVRTLTATLAALAPKKEEEEEDELSKIPKLLWAVKKVEECDFHFLKLVESADEATDESGFQLLKKELSAEAVLATSTDRGEQLVLDKCRVVITLSGTVSGRSVPLLLTRLYLSNVDVRNWSSMLSVTTGLSLEVASYNDQLAVWEPVIEPVEDDGRHRPWEITLKLQMNELLSADDDDDDDVPPTAAIQPQMTVDIVSSDVLLMTVSKSSLEVFNNLAQSFGDAYRLVDVDCVDSVTAPFIVKNETGLHISLQPDESFEVPAGAHDGKICLSLGQSIPLRIKASTAVKASPVTDYLYREGAGEKLKKLHFTVEDLKMTREIKVNRAEKRVYSVSRQSLPGGDWHVVSQIDVSYGCKIITLRSALQVHNCLPFAVNVSYKLTDNMRGQCCVIKPDETTSLPCDAVYSSSSEICFIPCVDGYGECITSCRWKDLCATNETKILSCTVADRKLPSLYFAARITTESVFFELTNEASAKLYTICLSPAIVLCNLLPFAISCLVEGTEASVAVEAGNNAKLLNACPGQTTIAITMTYHSKNWSGHIVVDTRKETLNICTFESLGDQKLTMDLGIHCEICSDGHRQLSLYSPYWMINKTGRNLTYKAAEDNIVSHKAEDGGDIVLFMLKHSKTTTANTALIKLDESEWSNRFSLDTVGSVGTIQIKFKDQTVMTKRRKSSDVKTLTVGVKITLSSSSLTKIVTFTPYYVIINQGKFAIECKEHGPSTEWVQIAPESCAPFWPSETGSQRKQMVARIHGTALDTQPFDITETHTTFLQLYHEYGGINVDCVVAEGVIKVVFQHYIQGFAAALLINHTIGSTIEYYQQDVSDRRQALGPGEVVMYAWQNPTASRELVWSCGETKNTKNELVKDGIGEFFADSDTKLYWVSFLEGSQRILLFTEDCAVATSAQQAGELERVEKEINISLQGFGISLINNTIRKELAYMGITSSGVIWELKKNKRFRALTVLQCNLLEENYQRYLQQLAAGRKIDGKLSLTESKIEVDFGVDPMTMSKPQKGTIRRTFNYGIWLQHRTSAHQTQLHIKVHRLQLDNQLAGAVFPTVLAPIPPPKTVAAEYAPKPFAELSVMIRKSDYSDVNQIKYCKLLVQEFAVKVDQGFLNAMLALFQSAAVDEEWQLKAFQDDCHLVKQSLLLSTVHTSAASIKNFYDELHFSPLKVHLSFSLYGADETGGAQIQWHMLSLFLQSVGIVLTDIQDVIFKLGYFERQHKFYDQKQLLSEITGHYSQQAIKQMYVLVLGLDVLGNPFGVIRGLATGIEDLFYEPYQGAIQGPEEFAEGLALGVKSLLGHAVGGAAGAVSRITGALGKGIATLTLDDEYQKRRREALNKRPADFKEGLARGGKGLLMGVVHGVTGIVTQPVEGAKQDGVGGFFKGVGKGLIGVFTRPASGVVDFASSSFEGIRRLSEMSDEVQRIRPSRLLQKDGIVRPFVFRDAEGNQILQDIDRGMFASDLYIAHLTLTADERSAIVVTDKQVIFTQKGEILGHWDNEWNYTWDQLKGPPSLTEKGLQFLLKERQKWLLGVGSGSIGKVVQISEKGRRSAEMLVAKMKTTMEAATTK